MYFAQRVTTLSVFLFFTNKVLFIQAKNYNSMGKLAIFEHFSILFEFAWSFQWSYLSKVVILIKNK